MLQKAARHPMPEGSSSPTKFRNSEGFDVLHKAAPALNDPKALDADLRNSEGDDVLRIWGQSRAQ